MSLPRTKKKPLLEFRALLRVDVDFGSGGILGNQGAKAAGCGQRLDA